MQDPARRLAATENPNVRSRFARPIARRRRRRVLRIAAIAVASTIAATTSAMAASGGLSTVSGGTGGTGGTGGGAPPNGPTATPGCPVSALGSRTLELGDCGDDVTTLNWILKAKQYGAPALVDEYDSPTESAVQEFQRDTDLKPDGVFDSESSGALIASMPAQIATWYGPGFFGNTTACGRTLTRRTLGVANRTLPCGSKVVLRYKGRFIRTKVIDRGPFANHAKWDLTEATAQALHFEYTDRVQVAAIRAH